MTISTCVAGLVAEGRIAPSKAQEAERLYTRSFHALKDSMGPSAAASEASERAIRALEAQALRRKRNVLLQANAQSAWLERIKAKSPEGGALSRKAAEDDIVAMDGLRDAVRKQALGMIEGFLSKHRRNLLGEVRQKSDMDNVVRELHGKNTGDVNAREIADAWGKAAEWMRSRFNAAGGDIGKLDSWALPQRHDMRLVRDAGVDAWKRFVVEQLDRSKMIDHETGLPMTDEALDDMLGSMWEAIATDGWSRNNPGGIRGAATANTRALHRVLHFADGDAWTRYAEQFGGGGTAMDAMLGHIEGMARDIAAMEKMGPNPQATLAFQQDMLAKSAATQLKPGREGDKLIAEAEKGANNLQGLFDTFAGTYMRPVSRRVALGFSIFRAQQVAAKLGGAFLSVGGDFGTMIATARYDKVPVAGMLKRYGAMLNPANMEDRRLAARLGLITDQWTNISAGQYRYTGEELTHEMSRRMAESVLRVSGLTLHTEAAQMAFGMEMMSMIVQHAGKSMDNLDPAMRRLLMNYDIDAGRWDALRATQVREERGTDWIFPEDIADAGLRDDLIRMIATEADHAVPMPDLRTRAFMETRLRRGTWMGELMRSAFLFKGFPLSIINLHGRRMMEQEGMGNRAKYGVGLLLMTTAGGALSLQLKEIAKGRDPQTMFESNGVPRAAFWAKAGLQGGGLGIFGDMISSTQNRFGGGVEQTLVGPGAQTFDNSVGAVTRNVIAAVDGDPDTETQAGRDAVKLLGSETPGVSLWYARAAIERLVKDTAMEWADPGAAQRSYKNMERYADEQDTAYWMPPGERMAARMPNFGNVVASDQDPLLMD